MTLALVLHHQGLASQYRWFAQGQTLSALSVFGFSGESMRLT